MTRHTIAQSKRRPVRWSGSSSANMGRLQNISNDRGDWYFHRYLHNHHHHQVFLILSMTAVIVLIPHRSYQQTFLAQLLCGLSLLLLLLFTEQHLTDLLLHLLSLLLLMRLYHLHFSHNHYHIAYRVPWSESGWILSLRAVPRIAFSIEICIFQRFFKNDFLKYFIRTSKVALIIRYTLKQ